MRRRASGQIYGEGQEKTERIIRDMMNLVDLAVRDLAAAGSEAYEKKKLSIIFVITQT